MNVLVTGGAGFIGSQVVRAALAAGARVLNYDALTYAANPLTLADLKGHDAYRFVHGDVTDLARLELTLADFAPDTIIHCAAETHVDRSIDAPAPFIHTNVVGTQILLEAALRYWRAKSSPEHFRLICVSTDEVFGSIPESEPAVKEDAPYNPSSPYSASKASADHLARAWHRTYGLPVIITNCGNNYGPCQFPEKLIPHMILRALAGESLPVYGDGRNIRDWIHVADHADALLFIASKGVPGETYLIGARHWARNIDLVHAICDALDAHKDRSHRELIAFVADRPGHDHRYAIDPAKITALGWRPKYKLDHGLHDTVHWYLANTAWIEAAYGKGYVRTRIGQREGLA